MTNPSFKMASVLEEEYGRLIKDINSRIDGFGFTLFPFSGELSMGIPPGWVTIGMTKIGLPEFYISGVAPYGEITKELNRRLKLLFEGNRNNAYQITNAEMCRELNTAAALQSPTAPSPFQWRPVDPTRLLYGQPMVLRRWLETEGLTELFTGIQIVHRDDVTGEFPMVSTERQLLIDYIPYGVKPQQEVADGATV